MGVVRTKQSNEHGQDGRRRWAFVLVAILALTILGCRKEEANTAGTNDTGFTVEPASEIGPDAFTAPFTADATICDKAAFLADLQSRPDALREWAKVLGMTVDAVPAYVATLQPMVLASD